MTTWLLLSLRASAGKVMPRSVSEKIALSLCASAVETCSLTWDQFEIRSSSDTAILQVEEGPSRACTARLIFASTSGAKIFDWVVSICSRKFVVAYVDMA